MFFEKRVREKFFIPTYLWFAFCWKPGIFFRTTPPYSHPHQSDRDGILTNKIFRIMQYFATLGRNVLYDEDVVRLFCWLQRCEEAVVTSFVKFLQFAVMLYNLKGNIDSLLFLTKLFLDYCEITTNFRYEVGKFQPVSMSLWCFEFLTSWWFLCF